MSGEYSSPKTAFERFVGFKGASADSLVGVVAYGIYKSAKREWLIERSRELGRTLTREDAQSYISFVTEDIEQRMKDDAKGVLDAFAGAAIERETPRIQGAARKRNEFWPAVGAGLVAAGLYSILLIIVAVIVVVFDSDVIGAIVRVHNLIRAEPIGPPHG